MRATIIRIIKQMINDKRSLALVLFAPMLLMTFMYFIFGTSNYIPSIVVKNVPSPLVEALKLQEVTLVESFDSHETILKEKIADAIISVENGQLIIEMIEPDSVKTTAVTKVLSAALKQMNPTALTLKMDFIYGANEANVFDSLGYALLGVLSFFFVFLIAGISFIRERTLGTMERFMLTPISRPAVVGGFLLGYGVFAVLQSILVVLYSKYVLSMVISGSILAVVVIMTLLAFVALALGAVVSVFANNEFQVVQFIPVIIVPQIFFSGLIPIDTLPYHLDKLAFLMPVYYACQGLKDVMIKGASLSDVLPVCGILLAFIFVLFGLNILLLKRYRTL